MKYLFFLIIILLPITINEAYASTYTSAAGGVGVIQYSDDVDDDDCTLAGDYSNSTGASKFSNALYSSANPSECLFATVEFDISGIPDGSTIGKVRLSFDVQSVNMPRNCDFVAIYEQPSAVTRTQNIIDDIYDDIDYLDNDDTCTTTGDNKQVLLTDPQVVTDIEAALAADWFAIGYKPNLFDPAVDADVSQHTSVGGATPEPTLIIEYYTGDAINDLISLDTRGISSDLSWSTPSTVSGTIQGYQVNFTTPQNENVATIAVNNTNSTTTLYTISGLTGLTDYSIRAGYWFTDGSQGNPNGNVLNITTEIDPTSSFTPGTFTLNFSGTDVREIKYERIDLNSTSLLLNVTAPNDFDLACNFYYKYAMVNKTYANLANVSINALEDEASFQFINVTNDVIDVTCWDQDTNVTANYLITQSDFPFLEQISNFRNGTYGTSGMFGALDFISMIAVIASMIGFNRVNETVGIIFGLFMIGALAVLSNGEIISWASTFTVGFAVLVMWAITTTRKD